MTDQPAKADLTSMDVAAEKRWQLAQLFPEVVTETRTEDGKLVHAVDYERLKGVLGEFSEILENQRERYGMTWPGKNECLKIIQQPSIATLKPCREESVNFDETENLFIEGDNLEALKLLQKAYYGKVKMIYIDPPYNTGKEFIYPDNWKEDLDTYLEYTGQADESGKKFSTNTESDGRYHSKWLNMMYVRLFLARNLLRDDGVLMVSIDENEVTNLRKVCDDVFGEENYCGEIVWKNSSKNDQDYISIQHEYIVVYVRDKNVNKGVWQERKEGIDEIFTAFDKFRATHGNDWDAIHKEALDWFKQFPPSNPISDSKHYTWMDERGVYFPDNISGPNYGQYRYAVIHPVTNEVCKEPASGWRYPEETMKQRIADGLVHFGKDHTTVPCNKTYLKDTEFQSLTSIKYQDSRAASNRLTALFGIKVFTNPKDELLLRDLLSTIGVTADEIVLDFFAGSATTMHAVTELNRSKGSHCRSIMVQLPEDLQEMQKRATGSAKKTAANAIEYLKKNGLPENIAEIGKQRARLVLAQKRDEQEAKQRTADESLSLDTIDEATRYQDLGFRVFKLDRSNFRLWDGSQPGEDPEKIAKQLELHEQHIDPNATQEDILYELLLKAGFPLTTKVERVEMAGKDVFSIAEGALLICLQDEITKELIKAMADADPLQVICLDSGFKNNDQLKANAVQTFKARNRGKDKESTIVFRTV